MAGKQGIRFRPCRRRDELTVLAKELRRRASVHTAAPMRIEGILQRGRGFNIHASGGPKRSGRRNGVKSVGFHRVDSSTHTSDQPRTTRRGVRDCSQFCFLRLLRRRSGSIRGILHKTKGGPTRQSRRRSSRRERGKLRVLDRLEGVVVLVARALVGTV